MIMKIVLILLLALTGFAVAADPLPSISLTLSTDEQRGLAYAVDASNATAKTAWDAAQASKPVEQRVAFVPVTSAAYLEARVRQVLASYADAESKARIASPDNQALIDSISRRTPEEIERVKAAIQKALGQ